MGTQWRYNGFYGADSHVVKDPRVGSKIITEIHVIANFVSSPGRVSNSVIGTGWRTPVIIPGVNSDCGRCIFHTGCDVVKYAIRVGNCPTDHRVGIVSAEYPLVIIVNLVE